MDEISRNISILLNIEKNYIPKAEYVFRTFCKILGLQPNFYYEYTPEDIHVYYGPPVEDRRPVEIFYNEKAAQFFNKKNVFNDEFHFLKYRGENIPFIFSEKGDVFLYTVKSLEIRKDIIASSFFFLSCWQEYTGNKKKEKENSDLTWTLQRIWDFEYIPVVDRYADVFQKALETMLPGYQKQIQWSHKRDFAVTISHLISNPEDNAALGKDESPKQTDEMRNGKIRKMISPLNFSKHLKKEEKLKISPEYILPLNISDHKKKSSSESNKDERHLHSNILNKTIGLYSSDTTTSETINKARTIYAEQGFVAQGYHLFCLKNHYQSLFESLEETEIKYDMSISYCDSLGYRAGISYPYYPFNLKDNRPFKVLEIPQTISNAVFHNMPQPTRIIKNYLGYFMNDALRFKNHLGLIWNHSPNINLSGLNFGFYMRYLHKLIKKNAWLCSPNEIYNHWVNR